MSISNIVCNYVHKISVDRISDILTNINCKFCLRCSNCILLMKNIVLHTISRVTKHDYETQDDDVYSFYVQYGIGGDDAKSLASKLFFSYVTLFSLFVSYSVNYCDNILFFNTRQDFLFFKTYEEKIYKIIRISPFCHKKQTSIVKTHFVCIKNTKFYLKDTDIEYSYTKSSGAGGQHINKTLTCVIAKHLPSGIRVKIGQERKQIDNKRIAQKTLLQKVSNYYNARDKTIRQNNPYNVHQTNFGGSFDRIINLFQNKYVKLHGYKLRLVSDDIDLLSILFLEIIFSGYKVV